MENMVNNRKNTRHATLARARVKSAFDGEALLRDLSTSGCSIEYSANINIGQNMYYMMEILPEKASLIESFELEVSSRWVKNTANSCAIGFTITPQPKGSPFQRYLEYVTWRSSPV